MLSFGLPRDATAWGALLLAFAIFFIKQPTWSVRVQLGLLCGAAFACSWGYHFFYLGGAPRIIDATAYLLEARSIADGSFSFPVPEPTASFRGRFLIHTAEDPKRLASIFPPGYPTLLALGVLLGAPFLIGPLLAAGITAGTYFLTWSLTHRRRDALVAATFSVVCACLRYHTAETMSHGLSVLLTTLSLGFAIRLQTRTTTRRRDLGLLGFCLGLLFATRQLTGAAITLSVAGTLLWRADRSLLKSTPWAILGAIPGVVLLLAHQHHISGDLFTSAQTRYYALADGPTDCFGLGLGKGCAYEHADVVAKHGGGLTLKWMVLNTLHRFHFHAMDVAHFEPLLLVPLGLLFRIRKRVVVRPVIGCLLLVPAAYSLFYFAGSYPGGGARFFSELLPLWHALLAWGLCTLRRVRLGLFLSLLGFATHASFSHQMLSQRSFGPNSRLLEEIPSLLKTKQKKSDPPVVFFSTAHEFNTIKLDESAFVAARRTRDDREPLLIQSLGAQEAFVYSSKNGRAALRLLTDEVERDTPTRGGTPAPVSLEAEADYPPLQTFNLWVHPEYLPLPCVSQGRALKLNVQGPHPRLELEVAGLPARTYQVELYGVTRSGECVRRAVGSHMPPQALRVSGKILANLTHIDRVTLTLPHR